MVDADEQPAQVRDDEPDEADRAGGRGRGAAEQHRAERGDAPGQRDALAEPGGELVAERERVQARADSRLTTMPTARNGATVTIVLQVAPPTPPICQDWTLAAMSPRAGRRR